MAASFMPLVGGSNIIEVRDPGGSAMAPAQISGVVAEGRAGTLKTSFLVALFGSVEAAASIDSLWGILGSFDIYGPYSHPVPANPGAAGFDYSSILPIARASLVCANFEPVGAAWPATLSDFLAAGSIPGQTYQLEPTLTAVAAPAANPQQYGKYTFTLNGGIPDPDNVIPSPLILIEVDFSHSVGN